MLLLDLHAVLLNQVAAVREAYLSFQQAKRALEEASQQAVGLLAAREQLQWRVDEIGALGLSQG